MSLSLSTYTHCIPIYVHIIYAVLLIYAPFGLRVRVAWPPLSPGCHPRARISQQVTGQRFQQSATAGLAQTRSPLPIFRYTP